MAVHNRLRDYLNSAYRFAYYNLHGRSIIYVSYKVLNGDSMSIEIGSFESKFYVTNPIEFHRVNSLVGEKLVLEDILQELNPDDVFYDIGSNIGLFACFASKKVKSGTVVAFEPHPKNFDRLCENNSLNDSNIHSYKMGLSNRQGVEQLTRGRDVAGAGGPKIQNSGREKESFEVELTTGDTFVRNRGDSPDVMKIDVEGHEQEVLEGFRETLIDSPCRAIYCEIHDQNSQSGGNSKSSVQDFLSGLGYKIEELPIERKIIKATYHNS